MNQRSIPESLWPLLEPLLADVAKPARYIGGEVNSATPDWALPAVRWCLMYPDAYEVGQPNQGLAILYELLNDSPDALAERSFTVWPDLAAKLRQAGIPQFSLESHRPLRAFDIIGVSLSTELGYTNLLETLDLAQIPLHATGRGLDDPLVVVGGHVACNPEPIADFIDVAILGDGEQAVLDLTEAVRAWWAAGRPGGREALLQALAATGRCYIPQFYDVTYAADATIAAVTPNRVVAPAKVRKYLLEQLNDWPYPRHPVVPLAETVHERYSVEIFRGCTRGCRFCQAGMITRPVRERRLDVIGAMVDQGLAATGLEEVGLLSLSSADHSEITAISQGLADRYAGSNVSLSLPSTRVDAFNIDLARELSRNGRRSGLTFAPEGGSERMRRIINKNVDAADLLATVEAAFSAGWRQLKLYFMCGLPGETDEDVLAIAQLAFDVIATGRRAAGSRDVGCTISIGGFVPKPHTPFQWAAQCPSDVIDHRLRLLRDTIRQDRRYGRAITVRYHDGRPGIVEGLLSRGDRRLGPVIEAVWRDGGRFDGWSEYFSFERWQRLTDEVLAEWGIGLDWYTSRPRDQSEVLPWDHLDVGLDRDWLWQDWCDACAEVPLGDCRWEGCSDCGVCPELSTHLDIGPSGTVLIPLTNVRGIKAAVPALDQTAGTRGGRELACPDADPGRDPVAQGESIGTGDSLTVVVDHG